MRNASGNGHLTVVGVGPGDPELLTVKAVHAIRETDVIVAPNAEVAAESLALSIISPWILEDSEVLELVYPMTRDKHELELHWKKAALAVQGVLDQGKNAVFITLGDPGVYSTWSYLQSGLLALGLSKKRWEVIPGITSFALGAAKLKRELCINEGSCAIVSMPETEAEFDSIAGQFSQIVVMKIGRRWPKLRAWLEAGRRSAYLVTRGGLTGERIDNVENIEPGEEGYLSLAIVEGEKGAGI